MKYRDFECKICHVVCVLSSSKIDVCLQCQDKLGFTDLLEGKINKIDQLKETIRAALAISDLWTYGERTHSLPKCEAWESEKKQLDELKESFEKALKGEL